MSESLKSIEKQINEFTQTSIGSTSSASLFDLKQLEELAASLFDLKQLEELALQFRTISDFKISKPRISDDIQMMGYACAPIRGVTASATYLDDSWDKDEGLTEEEKYERYISNKDW